MKPATSLWRWRKVAGTRRCTTSSPASATRQVPPTTSTPYTRVSVREDLPLVDLTHRHSSCYSAIGGGPARRRQEVGPGTPPPRQLSWGLSPTSENSVWAKFAFWDFSEI